MMSQGSLDRTVARCVARLLVASVLAAAWLVVWSVAPPLLLWCARGLPPRPVDSSPTEPPAVMEELRVTQDGQALLVQVPRGDSRSGGERYLTLERQPWTGNPRTTAWVSPAQVPELTAARPGQDRVTPLSSGSRSYPPRPEEQQLWYRVATPDGRAFYLVGYNRDTHRPLAWLGKAGFRSHCPPGSEWFRAAVVPPRAMPAAAGGPAQNTCTLVHDASRPVWGPLHRLIAADDRVYDALLLEARLEVLLACPGACSVSVQPLPAPDGYRREAVGPPWAALVARTPSSVLIQEYATDHARLYPLPLSFWRSSFSMSMLASGEAVIVRPVTVGTATRQAVWYGADRLAHRYLAFGWRNSARRTTLAAAPWASLAAVLGRSGSPLVALTTPGPPVAWWWSLLSSALAAWLVRRHQQHRRGEPAAVWIGFALVWGLPGWLAYLGRSTPRSRTRLNGHAVGRCDVCGRPAPPAPPALAD